METQFARVRTD